MELAHSGAAIGDSLHEELLRRGGKILVSGYIPNCERCRKRRGWGGKGLAKGTERPVGENLKEVAKKK